MQRIVEMFPSMDRAVVRSVLQENRGQLDATITRLLQITAGVCVFYRCPKDCLPLLTALGCTVSVILCLTDAVF